MTDPLLSSDVSVKRAFLVGVFDGRGSYDKTAKFIALDYNNDAIRDIVANVLNDLGIEANINSKATARVRRDSTSAPRKKQIRIKHIEFLLNIGFISPTRFNSATSNLPSHYDLMNSSDILPSLKYISSNQDTLF
ncbi:LAGLIDADG family homing endonuclease [Piscibacillus salipiscarius]|uniref:LAGLIDADG family homing endonuclease n=1 Tax=Piscibacillus salipiscarius TaxID=299480 RepID=UPI0024368D1B|nr:LAGLIDADG family homing endonuclease [Piscibacillus salipiscarius]